MHLLGQSRQRMFFLALMPAGLLAGLALASFLKSLGQLTFYLFLLSLPLVVVCLSATPSAISRWRNLKTQLEWWHVLWFMVVLSGLVFRIRDSQTIQESPIDFWALYRMGLMLIVALFLLGRMATRQARWIDSIFRGFIGLLAAYSLISLVSSIWSPFATWTLYKSFEYLVDIALISAILVVIRDTRQFKTLFDWTWVLLGCLSASVWGGLLMWPEEALQESAGLLGIQLMGVLPVIMANSVGEMGAILGVIALSRLQFSAAGGKGFYALVLTSSVMLLLLSQSRSPLAGFLLACALLLVVTRGAGVILASLLCLPGLVALTSFDTLFWEFVKRGQNVEQWTSLTGRTHWWSLAWEHFQESPWLGEGAYAGARFSVLAEAGLDATAHIHNTWVEIAVGTGLVGLLPVLLAFIGAWIILLRVLARIPGHRQEHRLALEALGILTVLSVRSIFSSSGIIWHPATFFLLAVGYLEFLRRRSSAARP